MNTHWSTPKTNVLAGLNCLRKALASGENARLIRAKNEDCAYPIKVRNSITDFRAYEFSVGLMKTRHQILEDEKMEGFNTHLTLNYKNCYGTQEAVDHYYETGLLSTDNFKGIGRSHLVKIEDLVRFHACQPNCEAKAYANIFAEQYFGTDTGGETHFYDHFRLKQEHSVYTIKRFKRKLWVVQLLTPFVNEPKPRTPFMVHVLNVLAYPFKFIPKKSVLRMKEYKCVTFRVGDVTNGFSLEFHIPKKFSFN